MIDYEKCASLGVATIYEAAGREGLIDVPLQRLVAESRAAGPARTVRCAQDDNLMVHAVVERVVPGDIVVLTMPEPRPIALIGDLLVTQLMTAGAAAVLVDASVRDADDLVKMGLPIWTRFVRARGAVKKTVGTIDEPVDVGGTTIAAGDLVVLDGDGACAISSSRIGDVIVAARKRLETERVARERYARGERSYDINDLRKIVTGARA